MKILHELEKAMGNRDKHGLSAEMPFPVSKDMKEEMERQERDEAQEYEDCKMGPKTLELNMDLKVSEETLASKQRRLVDLQKKMSTQLGASSAHLADVLADMNKMVLEVMHIGAPQWIAEDGLFQRDESPAEPIKTSVLADYGAQSLAEELERRGYEGPCTPPNADALTNAPGTIGTAEVSKGALVGRLTDEALLREMGARGLVSQPTLLLEDYYDEEIETEHAKRGLFEKISEEEAGGWVFVFRPSVDTIKTFSQKVVKYAVDSVGGASKRGAPQEASGLVGLTPNTISAWARDLGWRDGPDRGSSDEDE